MSSVIIERSEGYTDSKDEGFLVEDEEEDKADTALSAVELAEMNQQSNIATFLLIRLNYKSAHA